MKSNTKGRTQRLKKVTLFYFAVFCSLQLHLQKNYFVEKKSQFIRNSNFAEMIYWNLAFFVNPHQCIFNIWYTCSLSLYTSKSTPKHWVWTFYMTNMGDINIYITTYKYITHVVCCYRNPLVSCKKIPKLNFEAWKK